MKKVILKSTLVVVAVLASCLGAWKAYDYYGVVDNSLLMENIEALSDEDPEGNNEEWYLHHYDCFFTIDTELKLEKMVLFFKGAKEVQLGATVDLSYATQYFNKVKKKGEGPCEKGIQITCADLFRTIMDL